MTGVFFGVIADEDSSEKHLRPSSWAGLDSGDGCFVRFQNATLVSTFEYRASGLVIVNPLLYVVVILRVADSLNWDRRWPRSPQEYVRG